MNVRFPGRGSSKVIDDVGLPRVEAELADKDTSIKILSDNRQAGHNYFLMDRFEAGLVLTGTEVKSAKSGEKQLRERYATIDKIEAWLVNAHISVYSTRHIENHSPLPRLKSPLPPLHTD